MSSPRDIGPRDIGPHDIAPRASPPARDTARGLFDRALDLPPERRAAMLDDACASDAALRAEVESLLASLDEAGAFLDRTPVDAGPWAAEEGGLPPGAMVGRYRIVRPLGAGGMGAVYLAEQDRPARLVALKLLRPAPGDRSAIRRFELESRALGQLRHPGVAQIHEAGTQAMGAGATPFIAMEYVPDARTITAHAAEADLSIRQRVELFTQVCDAVAAAHQRGIIHRDLKPGNILVDPVLPDGPARVKVIDFGVARMIEPQPGATLHTTVGQLVGTLRYMSPEQCSGDPSQVDTRTDLYALGVVLYELLAGAPPYELKSTSLLEAPAIIRTAPPRPPSSIDPGLRGDLETILLKALAKEKERRYQSAGELGDDLRRWLDDRPILARPPSSLYQLRKFASRHRAAVAAAGVALAALVLGLVGTSVALVQVSRARAQAVAREREAQWRAYTSSVAAADAALQALNGGLARERLEAAPEALRGWEWRYLMGQSDRSLRRLRDEPVTSARAGPEGAPILAVAADPRAGVVALDPRTFEPRWRAALPTQVVDADEPGIVAGFSADGTLAVTSHGPHALLWDVRAGALRRAFELRGANWGTVLAHFDERRGRVVLSHRGGATFLVTPDSDTMEPWTLPEAAPKSGRWIVHDIVPGTGHYLVSDLLGLALADGESGALVRRFELPPGDLAPGAVNEYGLASVSPDGSLAAWGINYATLLLDVETGRVRHRLVGHTQRLGRPSFSPDGRWIATASWDRTVRVWDVTSGRCQGVLLGHASPLTDVTWTRTAEGEPRLISAGQDLHARVWDPFASPGGEIAAQHGTVTRLHGASRDGTRVLSAAVGSAATHLWTLEGGAWRGEPIPDSFGFEPAALMPDGRHALVGTADGSRGEMRELPAPRVLWARPWTRDQVFLAPSPDGRWILAIDRAAAKVHLVDASTGANAGAPAFPAELRTGTGHQPYASWSGDGGLAALVVRPQAVALVRADAGGRWSAADVALPQGLLVVCLRLHENGRVLAIGDASGDVSLWSLPEDAVSLRALTPDRRIATLGGMKPAVWDVAFSPDGTRLAAASQDREIHVFDTRTWQQLLVLRGHTGTVTSLEWAGGGSDLLSASYDGSVRVWRGPAPR